MAIRWNVERTSHHTMHPVTGKATTHSALRVTYPEGNILLSELSKAKDTAKRHARASADGAEVTVTPIYTQGMTAVAHVVAYWSGQER